MNCLFSIRRNGRRVARRSIGQQRRFDKSCFSVPANYTYGNSGPGILRADYVGNVTMLLAKQFRLREHSILQFRAEAFNLPNAVYFAGPSTSIDTATVGRITGTANSARQIQLGLKLSF